MQFFLKIFFLGALAVVSSLSYALELKGPVRIVSASLASDEILLELLKSEKDKKRLLAVSYLADDPKYSSVHEQLKHIPKRFRTDIEATIKMRPDLLVLASYNEAKFKKAFKRFKIPFLELQDFRSVQDIAQNINLIGEAIEKEKKAKELSKNFIAKVKEVSQRLKKNCPKPISLLPYSSTDVLPGKNTIFDSLLQELGIQNSVGAFGGKGWAKINIESISKLSPDFIVVSGSSDIKNIQQRAGWKWLKAAKHKKFVVVPENLLSSTSHHLAEAAIIIAKQVCPGLQE